MPFRTMVAALSAILLTSPAFAAGDEITLLRQELEQTKALVAQLETRLAAVEADQTAADTTADTAPPPTAAPVTASGSSPNAFNPAISAVMEGSYNAYSRSPEDAVIAGFAVDDAAQLPNEGFSLGESEINLSANIDPRFYGSSPPRWKTTTARRALLSKRHLLKPWVCPTAPA
ncbi:MAG: hypothetical protein R3F24_10850 [Gammaproteobacteria bacterium]